MPMPIFSQSTLYFAIFLSSACMACDNGLGWAIIKNSCERIRDWDIYADRRVFFTTIVYDQIQSPLILVLPTVCKTKGANFHDSAITSGSAKTFRVCILMRYDGA